MTINKRLKLGFAAVVAVCGLATAASAGTLTGLVQLVRVDADGRGMVQFDTPLNAAAGCCSGSTCSTTLAFDTRTAGGKAVLTLLTSAKLSGKRVAVTSAGTCTTYPGQAEDYSSGTLQP